MRRFAGTGSELAAKGALAAAISADPTGSPRQAIVLRDQAGVLRAYVNRCRHLPIPLDGGSQRFFDDSGDLLMCGTHGALYRREDGLCVEGPCRGLSLRPLPVSEDPDGTIWIEDALPFRAG